MTSEQQLADHWLKRNETLNAFILFEGGALSQEMLQIMMEHYKYRRISLYQLPDLKKVAAYGPWLVSIESEKDLAMVLVGKLPVTGIVFSELPLEQLASRLAVGCMTKTPDGREVLLRYYMPRVLKQLAARPDMEWHPVMFSQIESWWMLEDTRWQRLNMPLTVANNSDETVEIITLDEPLWQKIADRGDVSALLREWRTMKTSEHFPPCIQRNMVEKALNKAQAVGLTKPLDQKIYALSYPPARDRFHWRVLSHLGSNFLSMMDNAEILRGTLALYDWTESEMNRRRLEAIVDVQHSLIPRFERGFLLRGVDIQVTLDSNGFAGEGDITLFGELLHRFFALYADIHLFTQLTLILQPTGKCLQWTEHHSQRVPG